MKLQWTHTNHQKSSWALCDENDVILIYVHHDHRGWGVYAQSGAELDENRYGSADTAKRKAEEMVENEMG